MLAAYKAAPPKKSHTGQPRIGAVSETWNKTYEIEKLTPKAPNNKSAKTLATLLQGSVLF
jgi:hypothetical protein